MVGDEIARVLGERLPGVVADFRPRDIGRPIIEQMGQGAQNTALCLPSQPQQDEVMPRKHGIDDLRHYRVLITHDAGEDRCARTASGTKTLHQVFAHFILYGPVTQARLAVQGMAAQLPKRFRQHVLRGGCGCGGLFGRGHWDRNSWDKSGKAQRRSGENSRAAYGEKVDRRQENCLQPA